ncbi:hypothetical protein TRIATDRAFT_300836 [Trichoderma atroviride IMI 206040]|uniref:Uncharacterized protein n=1 Tax=Hypocrea atroviridis (strain ATCC 20476 / IMI 206040) TaxID=452589 RepID=G9P319_HYPAI|nr:uncharacterized protein TRIATDRAFT_300836 [Trichoderma atroviride IMI 206040]EHK42790.1 hypothetical protein TRIATDRAFT_300836 [Trichoderma atroviride IMI 206040]
MRCFRDASTVPDFGKEEIPIIAMTHVTAGRKKNGMKEKGRSEETGYIHWARDNAYGRKWRRYL